MTGVPEQSCSVVVLDDDAVYRDFVAMLLSKSAGMTVHEVATEEEICHLLEHSYVDCMVFDYDLGGSNGFAVKQALGAKFSALPPVVMLTGDGRERTVIKALRLGVDDYVSKHGLRSADLISAVNRAVEKGRKDKAARAESRRLIQIAGLDPVTRLHGRSYLEERLAQLAALPPRARSNYAILLARMNGLVDINTGFGLNAGDCAIRAFGNRLQGLIKPGDICGRFAGDTFFAVVGIPAGSGVLSETCLRLREQLAFRVELDAASIELSAQVGGTLCDKVSSGEISLPTLLVQEAQDALGRECQEDSSTALSSNAYERQSLVPRGRPEHEPTYSGSSDASPSPSGDRLRTVDRRRSPRQRVFKQGRIVLANKSTIDCTVRNVSEGVAGLRLASPFSVPHEFDFEIVGSGIRRPVRVWWQAGNDLGISYVI